MSTSCTSTPTATSTHLVTSSTVSTSFSEVVTTIPGTPSPIITVSCAAFSTPTGSASSVEPVCISSATSTIGTTTVGGGVSTTSVPVVTTISTVFSEFSTLFGSSCTTIATKDTTSNTPSPIVSVTTPPASTITSQSSSTLPNGDVTQVIVTITSVVPPSSFTVTSTGASPARSSPSSSSGSNHLGAIIGGVVGGVLALIILLVTIRCFIHRRQRRWDDIFENDVPAVMGAHRQDRGDLLADELYVEPKPYEYGVVGSQSISHSPYSADSHPSMRPPTAGSNQGYFGSSSPTHPLIPSSQDAHANANVQPQSQTQSRPLSPESVSARSGTARPVSPDGNFDYQHSSFSSAVLDGAERRLQVMNGDARDSMSIIAVTQGGQLDLHSPEGTAVGEGERRAEGSGSSLALASAGSGMKPRDLKSMRPSSSHVAGGTRSSKERDQAAVNRADDGRHLGDVMPPPAYEE